MNKKIIQKIKRKYAVMKEEFKEFAAYDKIVRMEWEGIPTLKNKDWYVEYIDTTGRDIVQQSVNIFSTQHPKWNILPRGLGDIEIAKKFEKTLEWHMWKASQ